MWAASIRAGTEIWHVVSVEFAIHLYHTKADHEPNSQ